MQSLALAEPHDAPGPDMPKNERVWLATPAGSRPLRFAMLGRGRAAAAFRHEGIELFAILRAFEFLDELGKGMRFFVEPAALFLKPLEFATTVLVEGEVAGGRISGACGRDAGIQEAEVLLDEALPLLRDGIAHHFPGQVDQGERPHEDESENDGS